MNPYASHLGDRAPLEVISETPRRLAQLVETIGPARLEVSPAPGKWSARDIISHLADAEIVFSFRLKQTLAEDHHVIQPFDQDLWAKSYPSCNTQLALAALSAVRAWNLALLQSVKLADLSKPVTHPERGTMTFQTIVETMAGHDRNHIQQIEAIAGQSASAS
jgi:uncharacterized damage-inducible protein DinB